MGGLSKKSAFVSTLSSKNATPTLLLDAGNLLFKQKTLPANTKEAEGARIKARGIVAINRQMGLNFAGIGQNDLAAGPDFLHALADSIGGKFTWLSLNLIDQKSGQRLFRGSTLTQAGELAVAVIALTNHDTAPAAGAASYSILPWRQVLPAAVAKLRTQADMLILLSNYPLTENREIARACPELDLIVQSGHAMGNLPPVVAGNTLITQTEIRGRYLGLLEIDWQRHGVWQQRSRGAVLDKASSASTYTQRFVPLDAAMPDDPVIDALVRRVEQQAQKAAR